MVRQMVRRIEPDLFARLMRLSATARSDILAYLGEASALAEDVLPRCASIHEETADPKSRKPRR